MRKSIYLFMVVGALLSCQNNKNYTILGKVADNAYEGTNVYLQQMTDDAMVTTDTTVVRNGAFSFSGAADTTTLHFIALDVAVNSPQESRIPVLLEPGKLRIAFDTVTTVKGSKANDAYTNSRLQQNKMVQNLRGIVRQFDDESAAGAITKSREAELKQFYDEASNQLTDLNFNFIKENIGNKLGEYIFLGSSSMFKPEQQKEILGLAGDEFKASKKIQRVIKRLENLEKVAVGKKFTDFTLKNTQGNEVSLSDYAGKGKYVLVDFWAAWCGPCREEMPNVVEAYNKYKAKGFEVVGVSLDQERDQWEQGIKELNMAWPQISDLQYWNSLVVDLYAINGIPHTILLDKEGTIIEKNLRGEALNAKLAELMP
ncbi:MAG: AhpC/TSA family protein [Proteiniphilum sp.]|jgi:peroxiredoxin|nr:AhpC/TSA family protein [Proteiniphilum sp.]